MIAAPDIVADCQILELQVWGSEEEVDIAASGVV